ncbi:MAG TPA: hypothetical protein ENH62_03750, partial [Marinobacter sp.]|nr:hypothetical protein [Marinobacter sp.]
MAGDVTVAVVDVVVPAMSSGTVDAIKSGFGTPKACIVIATYNIDGGTTPTAESNASIGFSDFTNNYCITHQDEDASAKVDCDALKSNTTVLNLMDVAANLIRSCTAGTITDGVRLTNNASTEQAFNATVIMFGGADLAVDLRSSAINSSQDGTASITHSGFTDGNDKLIFFIGTDISGEDSASTGINNSFGVCHA